MNYNITTTHNVMYTVLHIERFEIPLNTGCVTVKQQMCHFEIFCLVSPSSSLPEASMLSIKLQTTRVVRIPDEIKLQTTRVVKIPAEIKLQTTRVVTIPDEIKLQTTRVVKIPDEIKLQTTRVVKIPDEI